MRLVSTSEAWLGAGFIAAFVLEGDLAVPSRDPLSGTVFVTAGAAELFGY